MQPPSATTRKKQKGHYDRATLVALRAAFAVAQTLPPLAARLAHRLFYAPRATKRGALSLPDVEQLVLDLHGKRVSCYRVGAGKPALLIHGWESAVCRLEPLIKALVDAGFQVITFDMPAHGQSTGHDTDLREVSEIAMQLERRFGPFSAALGHSYGGVCLANCLRQGMRPGRIVLFATPASYESMIDRFSEFLRLRPGVKPAFVRAINKRYSPQSFEQHFNTASNLAAAATPALVVHDADDPSVPVAEGQQLAQAHPFVKMLKTEGLGHNRLMADAGVLARCIDYLTFS